MGSGGKGQKKGQGNERSARGQRQGKGGGAGSAELRPRSPFDVQEQRFDWQESRGRHSRTKRSSIRSADPAVEERRRWRDDGWQPPPIQPLEMTPGSWRWRNMQERGLEQERMARELRHGQLELGRAIQALNDRISAGAPARPPAPNSRTTSAAATSRSRSEHSAPRARVETSPSSYTYYTYTDDEEEMKTDGATTRAPAAPGLPPGLFLPVPAAAEAPAAGAAAATVHAAPVDPAAEPAPADAAYCAPLAEDPWATANSLLQPQPALVPVACHMGASRDPADKEEVSLPSVSSSDDEDNRTVSPSEVPTDVDLGQNNALARLAGLTPKLMARPRPGG